MKLCKYCNTEQPEKAFAVCKIVGGKVYRRRRCWSCYGISKRERIQALKCWMRDYKKTLSCLRCGLADHRALTFHHQNATEKELNVAEGPRREFSRARILREIAKCIVLCSNCHAITHADEWLAAKALAALPQPHPAVAVSDAPGSGVLDTRKVCRYCLVEQDESSFEVCKVIDGKAYRRHKCRACKQAAQNRRRHHLRSWLDDLKKTLRCAACGFSDYRALEFHHPDDQTKDLAIGAMLKDNRSVAAVRREIAKCVVLCANCHRIAHYKDPGWMAAPEDGVCAAF